MSAVQHKFHFMLAIFMIHMKLYEWVKRQYLLVTSFARDVSERTKKCFNFTKELVKYFEAEIRVLIKMTRKKYIKSEEQKDAQKP